MTRWSIRFWFCVAVAIVAASIADPLVERASNAGMFGPGDYTDHSNWDVLPTLLIGLSFAGLYVVLRVRQMLDGARRRVSHWLHASPHALGSQALRRLLPAIFAVQIATLYLMETTEQVVVRGHILGGTIWLGGPIFVSLAVHGLVCVTTMFVIGWALRLIAQTAFRIVRLVFELVTLLMSHSEASSRCYSQPETRRYAAPVPTVNGGRAPPAACSIVA